MNASHCHGIFFSSKYDLYLCHVVGCSTSSIWAVRVRQHLRHARCNVIEEWVNRFIMLRFSRPCCNCTRRKLALACYDSLLVIPIQTAPFDITPIVCVYKKLLISDFKRLAETVIKHTTMTACMFLTWAVLRTRCMPRASWLVCDNSSWTCINQKTWSHPAARCIACTQYADLRVGTDTLGADCLSIYLSIYRCIWLSDYCLSICLFAYLSIGLSIYLSIYVSICLCSYCLYICLSIRLFAYLSIGLSIYLSIYLSICPSVYLTNLLYSSIYIYTAWLHAHLWSRISDSLRQDRHTISCLQLYTHVHGHQDVQLYECLHEQARCVSGHCCTHVMASREPWKI